MDVIYWVLVKGSYLLGLMVVLGLSLLAVFGLSALGSAVLVRARGNKPVAGRVVLNLLAGVVFGILLAVSIPDASGPTTDSTFAFIADAWNGFSSTDFGQIGTVLWALLESLFTGLTAWASIPPSFADAIASDLGERGNFAIFFVPSLLCLTGLVGYDIVKSSPHGFLAGVAHLAIFANAVALAAFLTWLVMTTWMALLIIGFLGMLTGGSRPARYVVWRA